jgi:hypothetical protein
MSQVRMEQGLYLLGRCSGALRKFCSNSTSKPGRRASLWSSSALDKLVSCVAIAVLAPAILAVWIAIKRSAPAKTTIAHNTPADVATAQTPLLLTIKSIGISAPRKVAKMRIAANRAVSA